MNYRNIECFKDSSDVSTTVGDPSGMASSNCSLGDVYDSIGQLKKAINHYEKGSDINTAISNQSGIATNNGNLGNVYLGSVA